MAGAASRDAALAAQAAQVVRVRLTGCDTRPPEHLPRRRRCTTEADRPGAVILDDLSAAEAASRLRVCCGARRWVDAMVAARPFKTPERACELADRVWDGLDRDDWLEAFDHHPRIGEQKAVVAQDA